MKNTKEINEMLEKRFVIIEGIKDDVEETMNDFDTKKNSKKYRKAKEEHEEYFIRGVELIRIYADINDISFFDAMNILNAKYNKSKRVAQ